MSTSSTSTSHSREIPSSEVLTLKEHTNKILFLLPGEISCYNEMPRTVKCNVFTANNAIPNISCTNFFLLFAYPSEEFRIWHINDGIYGSNLRVESTRALLLNNVPKVGVGLKYNAALDWNKDGTLLATGSFDGKARIWRISGELESTISEHTEAITALKWNKNNSYILTGSIDKTAYVWDVENSTMKQFHYHAGCVNDVDWRDKDYYATGSSDRTIDVCKIGEILPIKTFIGHQDIVNCVKWDPTGSVLASCSCDSTVKIWSMEKDQCVHNFKNHEKGVCFIRWSPTGPDTDNPNQPSILASGSKDSTVKLWDVEQGKLLCSLNGHWDTISCLAFSPNGEYLASGSQGQINIWSVKEKYLIRSYIGQSGGVAGVCWDKEGNKIAAGFADGSVCFLNFRM
ncbi:hypothetical protein BUALT_BualtUnG0057600 [Buddleja alternifolia]|uniref:WDHD1 first WD40 domain-containing protein n=1 Tax=Buddleja alternifolia TaxID=168488 RepID=A0AAV6VYU6_9LAMI|nr:hypothetical protein BUALT_BualtUnG0057600 [Buddleja alternifolia]